MVGILLTLMAALGVIALAFYSSENDPARDRFAEVLVHSPARNRRRLR
jgi:hypothetical protein